MPFFYHPDIKTYNYQASFLNRGVYNIYTYLFDNREKLPIKEEFVYFPLTYFFLGAYQLVVSPFLGTDFYEWLSDASQTSVERIGVYRYLFILKFPYLILDLVIAFLLIRFFKERLEQRFVFILWLFNPISIAVIYVFSNIDIVPIFLSIISLLLFRKHKILPSALLLGLSAGFKPFTLLFLPIFLLFNNNLRERIIYALTYIVILILLVIPFWSKAFFNSALLTSLTTRIAYPGIPIGFGESLMLGVVSLSVFYLWAFLKKDKVLDDIFFYLFSLFLILFSTIHFHIQWLLWITPFLTIVSVSRKDLSKLFYVWLFLAFFIPILYNDQAMNVSLLSAVSLLYKSLPTVFTVVEKIYDPTLLQSIMHSMIFGLGLVLILKILRIEKS